VEFELQTTSHTRRDTPHNSDYLIYSIFVCEALTSYLYRHHHLAISISTTSQPLILCPFQVTRLMNGLILPQFQMSRMVYSIGLPWVQVDIHWLQWQKISCPSPVCTNLKYSIICLITRYAATSTDVERAFSRGGLTVSKMRHSLSDESTRAASVLGAWCDLSGAIPRDEILEVFRDKGKRPKDNNV
jgi:hypothetical protein